MSVDTLQFCFYRLDSEISYDFRASSNVVGLYITFKRPQVKKKRGAAVSHVFTIFHVPFFGMLNLPGGSSLETK